MRNLSKDHGSRHDSGVEKRRAFGASASGVAESRVTSETARHIKSVPHWFQNRRQGIILENGDTNPSDEHNASHKRANW